MKRAEAVALGLKKYKPDYPCRRGHTTPRYTSTGNCIECLTETRKTLVKDIRAAQMSRAGGFVRVSLEVRPQDVAMLTELAEALKLSGPPVQVPAVPGVAPALPPIDIQVERQRIFGEMGIRLPEVTSEPPGGY